MCRINAQMTLADLKKHVSFCLAFYSMRIFTLFYLF
jgi:cold shock CspA family protein